MVAQILKEHDSPTFQALEHYQAGDLPIAEAGNAAEVATYLRQMKKELREAGK
jgi:hypothetical protein